MEKSNFRLWSMFYKISLCAVGTIPRVREGAQLTNSVIVFSVLLIPATFIPSVFR